MKKVLFLLAVLALTLTSKAAFCDTTVIDKVVAVVGQDVVTLSELQSEMAPALAELNQKYRGEELARATDKLRRGTLNSLIDKYLQIQEAKVQGIDVTDADVDTAIADIMKKNNMDKDAFAAALAQEGYTPEDYKKNLKDQLAVLRLVNRAVKSKIMIKEDEVEEYYKENIAKFTTAENVRVANIMFPAQGGDMAKALQNANDARAKIMAGTEFEEMAATCSGDPKAAKTCVLGTFSKGELSSVIEERAFKMKTGEVSEPIQVENGYQLIKVMDHTTGGVKPLSEVRQQVVDQLTVQKGETLFAKWVQDLRKHTYVEIRE